MGCMGKLNEHGVFLLHILRSQCKRSLHADALSNFPGPVLPLPMFCWTAYIPVMPAAPLIPTALGYLLGPTLGSSLFSLTHPKLARGNPAPLEIMDREFFARIKRNRVDPSFQSVNNPAPDFYGEKVCVVTGDDELLIILPVVAIHCSNASRFHSLPTRPFPRRIHRSLPFQRIGDGCVIRWHTNVKLFMESHSRRRRTRCSKCISLVQYGWRTG
jgi:hypothetical protein